MLAFALGLAAGVAIVLLMQVVETSRLTFVPPFYGSVASIVPAVGVALALYGIWTWAVRGARPRLELLWSAIGLHLGVGTLSLSLSRPTLDGFFFFVLFLVVPTALTTFGVLWALERRLAPFSAASPRSSALILTAVVSVGLVLAVSPLAIVATGLIAGAFIPVGTARASTGAAVKLGALLLVVLLAAGLAAKLHLDF